MALRVTSRILTELSDTFQGQLLLLHQDSDRVTHELLGDLEHIGGHGGGQQDNLGLSGQKLEDVVHRLGETLAQHLVGLVKGKDLHAVGLQEVSVDHVEHSTGGTDDDLRARRELGNVLLDGGTTDAGVAVDVHVVTEGDNDLLDLLGQFSGRGQDQGLRLLLAGVDSLQDGDGEGGGLTGTGLSLGNAVSASDDGHNGSLLDGGGSLETVGVDTSEELGLQVHVVEAERG